jgi:hypothetical protein
VTLLSPVEETGIIVYLILDDFSAPILADAVLGTHIGTFSASRTFVIIYGRVFPLNL